MRSAPFLRSAARWSNPKPCRAFSYKLPYGPNTPTRNPPRTLWYIWGQFFFPQEAQAAVLNDSMDLDSPVAAVAGTGAVSARCAARTTPAGKCPPCQCRLPASTPLTAPSCPPTAAELTSRADTFVVSPGFRDALRACTQWPSADPQLLTVKQLGDAQLLPSLCMYYPSLKPPSTHLQTLLGG